MTKGFSLVDWWDRNPHRAHTIWRRGTCLSLEDVHTTSSSSLATFLAKSRLRLGHVTQSACSQPEDQHFVRNLIGFGAPKSGWWHRAHVSQERSFTSRNRRPWISSGSGRENTIQIIAEISRAYGLSSEVVDRCYSILDQLEQQGLVRRSEKVPIIRQRDEHQPHQPEEL